MADRILSMDGIAIDLRAIQVVLPLQGPPGWRWYAVQLHGASVTLNNDAAIGGTPLVPRDELVRLWKEALS